MLLSDFRRQMLPSYGAMETNEQSPIFRYAKRAYFIIDKNAVLRWQNIKHNPLDLLDPDEVLKALKDLGTRHVGSRSQASSWRWSCRALSPPNPTSTV